MELNLNTDAAEVIQLASLCKQGVQIVHVYGMTSLKKYAYSDDYLNLGTLELSSMTAWRMMYNANLVTNYDSLKITGTEPKPTTLAGFGLAAYLGSQTNLEEYGKQSYDDYKTAASGASFSTVSETIYNTCVGLFGGTIAFSDVYDSDAVQTLTLQDANSSSFIEQEFNVSKATYTIDFGIFQMDRRYDDNTITSYDRIYLSDWSGKVYSYNNSKKKWEYATKFDTQEIGLKVIRWNGSEYTTKVYRFQDKTLRTYSIGSIQRDEEGNWYIGATINEKYYIYQLDRQLNVTAKTCIDDLFDDQYNGFLVQGVGKVLMRTYKIAGENNAKNTNYTDHRIYSNMQLINIKTGKVSKTLSNTSGQMSDTQIYDGSIFTVDGSGENIVVYNSSNGEIEHVYSMAGIPELLEDYVYSSELGGSYSMDMCVYKNYIYILKHTGVYKINRTNGTCVKIIDGTSNPFQSNEFVFTDFKVVSAKEMYMMGVYFDDESASTLLKCATD